MINKPLENPKLIGCLTCGKIPAKVLNKNKILYGYPNLSTIAFDENKHYTVEDITVKQIERNYRKEIEQSNCTVLEIEGALHGEIYEYNKDDGNWYLVKQTKGYA